MTDYEFQLAFFSTVAVCLAGLMALSLWLENE